MNGTRLLVFTNDYDESGDLLGFLPGRVNALAGSVDGVHVMSQHIGTFARHPRVSVHEIPKREHPSRISRVLLVIRKAWVLRDHYDAAMVIMAPSWAIMFGLLTRLLGKRCVLWYAVWRGGFRLRLATLVCHQVLTSVSEAFPFASPKVVAVGQGIDTSLFSPDSTPRIEKRILFLGRISRVKRLRDLLDSLSSMEPEWTLDIVGAPVSGDDEGYVTELKGLVGEKGFADRVRWLGRIPHSDVPRLYRSADVFVSLTPAGSFDKTALEAMASGVIVLSSNPALLRSLSGEDQSLCDVRGGVAAGLRRIGSLATEDRNSLRQRLRDVVVSHHSLQQWVQKTVQALA